MAKKKKGLFPVKGNAFTYEEWAPSDSNPFIIRDTSQEDLISEYKSIYSDAEFPIVISKFAKMFPQNPDIALSLAKGGVDEASASTAQRMQTILNESYGAVTANKPWETTNEDVNNLDYTEYLAALKKDSTTATPQDAEDGFWFANIKRATRIGLSGLFTFGEVVGNTVRQVDGALNQNEGSVNDPSNIVVGGEDAKDFTRIYKNTTAYQNIVEGKDIGTGFIPAGEAYVAKELLTSRVARIRSAKTGKEYFYTPGRGVVSALTPLDPEDSAYKVLSGIIDAVLAFRTDPGMGASKAVQKYKAIEQTRNLREATSAATSAKATIGVVDEIANYKANLPSKAALDALKNQKVAATELDDVYAGIAQQRNILNQAITDGTVAQLPQSVQRMITKSGLTQLDETRLSLLSKLEDQKKFALGVVTDPATGVAMSKADSTSYLKNALKENQDSINVALDNIYVTRSKKVRDALELKKSALQKASDDLVEKYKSAQEIGTPDAKQRFIMEERAGLLQVSDGYKVNRTKAVEWLFGKNADVIFERIADINSPAEIMRLSKGKFDADLAKELSAAKTVDDVEVTLLGRIGINVDTAMPRSAIGRYIVDNNPNFIMKAKPSSGNLTELARIGTYLKTKVPTGKSIKLDDTIGLVKEVQTWMVAARYNVDEIDKVVDNIINSSDLDFKLRQKIITTMLDDTVSKYADELKLSPTIKNKLTQITTAYDTSTSGIKQYTSQALGEEVGNRFVANGELFDLTGLPSAIGQLATEISLPNVFAVRELTGVTARAMRSVDDVVSKEGRFAEKAAFASQRFIRSASDGFLRSILLVGRGAFIVRNIAEMQVRMYLAGGIGMFTDPVKFTALIMSNPASAKALVKKAAAKDPYTVDINGKAFMSMELKNANDTQVMYDSFANVMAERGFALEGKNVQAANRSGEFTQIKLDISSNGEVRNAQDYAQALAARLLQHRADPIKRMIATENVSGLSKGAQKAIKEGRMTYQDAVVQAIRDGAFERQVDILGKSVPELKRLLSSDEGIKLLLFGKTSRSYAREIADETLGLTELRQFVSTGKINTTVEETVDGITSLVERPIFEMTNDYVKNHRKLTNIIKKQLIEDDTVKQNASKLFLPYSVGMKTTRRENFKSYSNFADSFFRTSARIETRTVYGPEYRVAYWAAVSDMAPLMSKETAKNILKDAEDIQKTRVAIENGDGTIVYQKWTEKNPAFNDIVEASKDGVGRLTVKDIDDYARDQAAKRIASMFYDATQKNNLTYAAQLVLPFVNAWANTMKKWSQLGTNPARFASRVYPAARVYKALTSEQSSVFYDITGTPNDPSQGFIWTNQYDEKVFTIPLSGYLRTLFGLRGDPNTADVSVPLSSLNLALGGAELAGSDLGLIPGVGTVWNFAYGALDNEIQQKVPDVLAEMIAPYGTKEGKYLAPLPAWIQKIAAALVEDENAYGKLAKPIMAWEATTNPKYKPLYDGTALSPEERADLQGDLASYGLSRARFSYLMQGLLQNVLPGTPVYEYYAKNTGGDTFMQWQMAQSFTQIAEQHNGNFDTAWAEYAGVWGRGAILTGFSDNKNGIFANDEAWSFAKQNQSLFNSYGDVIPYFFTGGDFSTEYRRAMERRGKGNKLTPEEVLKEADRLSISAMRGQLAVEATVNGFDSNWIDAQMRSYKADVLQGYEPETTITVGGRDQKIMRIQSALKKPEFSGTDAGQAATIYFNERDKWLEQSSLYYPDRANPSLSGADNFEARYRLRLLAEQLSGNNDDFKNMFIRVLSQELKEEG